MSFRALAYFLIVCLLPIKLFAAGPIMHIALAERYLAANHPKYSEEDQKLFMLGTLFPDIRYLGVLDRNQTHFKNVTLEKINKETSSFKKGMLFHSFVDEQRSKLVRESGIEKKIPEVPSRLRGIFLKLVEDQILHSQSDWQQIRNYLIAIPEEERAFGVNLQVLSEWHTGLSIYFTTEASLLLMQLSFFEKDILMVDAPTIKLWSVLLPKYTQEVFMQEYVKHMMSAFEKMI